MERVKIRLRDAIKTWEQFIYTSKNAVGEATTCKHTEICGWKSYRKMVLKDTPSTFTRSELWDVHTAS